MNHGSLFTGIGGFDYAAQLMGWENLFHCEKNQFCQHVLKYYWPNVTTYDDITTTDFTVWRGRIDVLTGGFPCQPYSVAGKQLGTEDERHLWPQMLRAIREIAPPWVVGENVRGLTNWNGGLVFEQVCAELEALGYEVQPFLLPAAGVGAPHERYRIWFIAYSRSARSQRAYNNTSTPQWIQQQSSKCHCKKGIISHAQSSEQQNTISSRNGSDGASGSGGDRVDTNTGSPIQQELNASTVSDRPRFNTGLSAEYWSHWPTVAPICDGDDGLSSRLDSAALLNGRTPRQPWRAFGKWRNESIHAGGNAIVPQVALQIFKAIQAYEENHL